MFFRSKTLRTVIKNKKYLKDYLQVLEASVGKNTKDFDITIFDGWKTGKSKYVYYDMVHEQGVYLKSLGYTVEVYSSNEKFKTPAVIDGIIYKYYCKFNINKKYNILLWSGLVAATPFFTNKIRLKTNKTILYNPDFDGGIQLYKDYLDEIGTVVLDNKILESIIIGNVKFKNYQLEEWKEKTHIISNSFNRTTNINNYSKIENSFYICVYHTACVEDLLVYLKIIFPKLHELYNNVTVHLYNFEILEDASTTKKDLLEEIRSKEYYTIHRSKTYNEILQEKYKYKYQLYLYQSVAVSHLTICDLRHSLYVNCIPIISREVFMMFSDFKCFVGSPQRPFKLNELFGLLSSICNFPTEKVQIMEEHNHKIFEKNYSQKKWGDEFIKLIK